MWRPLSPEPTRDPSRWLRASQDRGSGLSEPAMKTLGSTAKWSTASLAEITRVSAKFFCRESDVWTNPHYVSLSLFLCPSVRRVHGFSGGGRASGEEGRGAGQRDDGLLQHHRHSTRPGNPVSQQLGGPLLHKHTQADTRSRHILLNNRVLASFTPVL